ncbi:hypothetical protein BCR33DRAFT_792744 [Rhizoclosmatium globosum]|uniref:Uncharacterized protein n=1 Tax=Rhizoclosmatium globosum TaxID=329046 RepID=A0A1Y2B6F6_9FUNG|nr:hypothetical protein BCR33DRAFT_792744 [Rhizoclosmatium globosum]|eukprot:ORY30120.1 hypothetical protein BCR33DRAFT_792744 [Rhizoclosmatium globosum]
MIVLSERIPVETRFHSALTSPNHATPSQSPSKPKAVSKHESQLMTCNPFLAWTLIAPFVNGCVEASRLSRTCKDIFEICEDRCIQCRFSRSLFELVADDVCEGALLRHTPLAQQPLNRLMIHAFILGRIIDSVNAASITHLLHHCMRDDPYFSFYSRCTYASIVSYAGLTIFDVYIHIPSNFDLKEYAGGLLLLRCGYDDRLVEFELSIPIIDTPSWLKINQVSQFNLFEYFETAALELIPIFPSSQTDSATNRLSNILKRFLPSLTLKDVINILFNPPTHLFPSQGHMREATFHETPSIKFLHTSSLAKHAFLSDYLLSGKVINELCCRRQNNVTRQVCLILTPNDIASWLPTPILTKFLKTISSNSHIILSDQASVSSLFSQLSLHHGPYKWSFEVELSESSFSVTFDASKSALYRPQMIQTEGKRRLKLFMSNTTMHDPGRVFNQYLCGGIVRDMHASFGVKFGNGDEAKKLLSFLSCASGAACAGERIGMGIWFSWTELIVNNEGECALEFSRLLGVEGILKSALGVINDCCKPRRKELAP